MSLFKQFGQFKQPINMEAQSMSKEGSPEISSFRYSRAMEHIMLLRVMNEIDNKEVKRLISLLKSPDHENWTVAEECIKQKLSTDNS